MSVENQRVIIIRNPGVEKDFIQVEKKDLQAASRMLTPAQLIIYIDLCGNTDGFPKEFSPAYFKNNYGISKDTAQKAFHVLEEKGFITKEDGKFYFNRQPKINEEKNDTYMEKSYTYMEKPYTYMEKPDRVYEKTIYPIGKNSREIDKKDNIDKIDKIDFRESLRSSQEPQVIEVVGAQEPIKRRKEKLEAFRF